MRYFKDTNFDSSMNNINYLYKNKLFCFALTTRKASSLLIKRCLPNFHKLGNCNSAKNKCDYDFK